MVTPYSNTKIVISKPTLIQVLYHVLIRELINEEVSEGESEGTKERGCEEINTRKTRDNYSIYMMQ